MHPILLKIGPITLFSYGFMMSLAFLAGILISVYLGKEEGIEPEKILEITVWVIVFAIIGARIFFVIQFWNEFENPFIEAFLINQGGLVFYGGLFGAIIALIWRTRQQNLPLWKILDLAAPAAAIGYSFGRIGCFLNGCCYGIQTNVRWAVHFPNLTGLRHPTQLYASFTSFVILLVLLLLWKKRKFEGQIFLAGVLLYSIYRFFIEYFRVGPRYVFSLTISQWVSVFAFLIVGGVIIWKTKQVSKKF